MRRRLIYIAVVFFTATLAIASLSYSSAAESDTDDPTYVGAEACSGCHEEEYSNWKETPHANMAGIVEVNVSGTYYWVHRPDYIVMSEQDFIDRCARCHVTGWDPDSKTWPEFDTDRAKFLNVQCEVCHGAGMAQPWGEASMKVDYSPELCGQCHHQADDLEAIVDLIGRGHTSSMKDLRESEHAADYCLKCHSTPAFLYSQNELKYPKTDITYTLDMEQEGISCTVCHDTHPKTIYEHQLRFEDISELCGQCHTGSYNPQYDMFANGPHENAGLVCTSCHGQGTRLFHEEVELWMNHTFWLYNTYYPYSQTETTPIVCSNCHDTSWAETQFQILKTNIASALTSLSATIDEAKAAITDANRTAGVDVSVIAKASELIEKAEDSAHRVENDKSHGVHNPDMTYMLLVEASRLAGEARSIALKAKADVAVAEAVTVTTTLPGKTSTVTSTVSGPITTVTSTQIKASTVTSTAVTTTSVIKTSTVAAPGPAATDIYLFLGIGVVVGIIVGIGVGVIGRRRST